jgi:endothelin-converting enzyme/putative endopeptidase
MRQANRTSFARLALLGLAGVMPMPAVTGFQALLAQQESRGVVRANMDPDVKPGDDFFRYCNGGWLKRTEIPADRASVGVFLELRDKSDQRVKGLIEDAVASAKPGSERRKIADYYTAYLDEAGIEAKGRKPIERELAGMQQIKDRKELSHALGETLRADVDALNNTNFHTHNLFGLWVAPDFDDSEHYAPYLIQGGLEMPDREYYLGQSDRMKGLREQYQKHVAAMLKLANLSNAEERAAKIVELERAIAEVHLPLADNEDIHKANNHWKRADFAEKAPGLDWEEYFRGAGLQQREVFIVWEPGAFAGESALVASQPLEVWKDWLAFHWIEAYADQLPKAIAEEHFAFFGTALTGATEQRPRWQRAVVLENAQLGDAVGQLYAKQYFPPQSRERIEKMVANIKAAFRRRIEALDWMDPATKKEAQEKLNTLYVGIGYADQWQDYSRYEVRADDAYGNAVRAGEFRYREQVAELGRPVNHKQWSMTPQTVNAVNLPLQNALNFPAAILEPPFFDPHADDAFNYGAIGSVIGHEVSHTFDTEGAAFDAKGSVRNWWTPADLSHFEASTQKLAEQYDTYRPFPDLTVNGKQTLAENIADVAGIAASYDAFRGEQGTRSLPDQAGFNSEQQFFLAYGQTRASKARESALRRQVLTDPHSPSEYRTDTVRNINAWYAAFGVKEGDKLYLTPEQRVKIW